LLAIQRPFLSLLLAVGTPAYYSFQSLDHQDPLRDLKHPCRLLPQMHLSYSTHILISVLQYLLAFATTINVLTVSLQLGLSTIVTWKKLNPFFL
jgi:hypothetical protein